MNTISTINMRRWKLGGICCLLFFASMLTAQADPLSDWSISGTNTIRAEYYDIDGDHNTSPWPHHGSQFYNELDLNLHRRISPWESLRFSLSGLANSSDYRSNEQGGLLERGLLYWEKGDAAIPFRLQLGDYYAAQSPRTLQRGLKGLQVELQPGSGHSIQLFSGIAAPVYRHLDAELGIYSGASWLIEGQTLGAFSLTGVHHNRGENSSQIELNQSVASLAWYKPFSVGSQDLDFETELAFFSGEYDDGGSLVDSEDKGYYVQFGSHAQQLNYRLLFEQYGEDFRPAGGALTPDHRAVEGHAGWIFTSGIRLRGRVQSFRDNLESNNPLDTDLAGLSLSGPLWHGSSLHVGIDAFAQKREDRTQTLETETRNISINLNQPITSRLSARGGVIWTATDDRLNDVVSINRQLKVAVDARFSAWGWHGTFSPGVILRDVSGVSESSEVNPTLAVILSNGAHNLMFSHNWINYDGHSDITIDTTLQKTALAYNYRKGQHRLGLEINRFDRDPDGESDTEAYRLSAYWSVSFDRPAQVVALMPAKNADIEKFSVLSDLLELSVGTSLDEIEIHLSRNHQTPAYRLPGLDIYEMQLLEKLDLRQRLGLIHESGILREVNLALDFIDTSNINSMARDYAHARDLLLKKYGVPKDFQEEGIFSDQLTVDLAMGRFERTLEWKTDSGTMRFGIPQRLDGQLRMEILHARTLPAGRNWGVEALR